MWYNLNLSSNDALRFLSPPPFVGAGEDSRHALSIPAPLCGGRLGWGPADILQKQGAIETTLLARLSKASPPPRPAPIEEGGGGKIHGMRFLSPPPFCGGGLASVF